MTDTKKPVATPPTIAAHPPVKAVTTPAPSQPPPPPSLNRSWSLRSVRLPREEIIIAIDKSQSVPKEAKEWLKGMVQALDKDISLVQLDAHSFASPTHITVHMTASRL